MRLLLDTHAFLWWITDAPSLSAKARDAIADTGSQLHLSAASLWEISIKYALGRLPLPLTPAEYLPRHIDRNGISVLAIEDTHTYRLATLPPHHADPFDRMLIAQAELEKLTLVSGDAALRNYDAALLW